MEGVIVEIREPGRKPRRVPVTARVEVGRDCRGLLLHDDAASRRHITLTPGPDGLFVTDLGSSNGTFVNGAQLTGRPQQIGPGDVIRLGETEISIPAPAGADAETVSAMVPGPPPARRPAAGSPPPPPAATAPPARPPRHPAPAPAPTPTPTPTPGLSLDERTGRRLAAAHGYAEVEVGGVEWSRFVESVIDAGLEQLPAVIARLRAEGGRGAP
ncbi:MAG TPA: FHA domain-containing protein [Candidatus Dormibacteraeota bacterium]|jgi:pyruvate/2-oxoglutarate dehydrogenase complex dihydrolipoamide acyltransferase (E2) component